MIKTGKIEKENISTIYTKIKQETKEKGYTEEETKTILLRFLSEEDIKKCEKLNLEHIENTYKARLKELNEIKNKINILNAIMEYKHYLFITDFDTSMTKIKYEKINNIYETMKESGMENNEILKNLKKQLTSEDIETLIKYVEIEENIEVYKEYMELSENIKRDKNKGHRVRKFAKSWKL